MTLFWAATPPAPSDSPNPRAFWITTIMRSPVPGQEWVANGDSEILPTNSAMSFHAKVLNAFDDGGSGIVNAVQDGLGIG